MFRYLIGRILQLGLVAFGSATLVFFLLRLSGDPVLQIVGDFASAEDIEALRRALGLDVSIPQQYLNMLRGIVTGDIGSSIRYNQPVTALIRTHLSATMELAAAAFLLSVLVGGLIGVLAAFRRGTVVDRSAMFLGLLGQSVPTFWLGIMLMLIFGVRLKLLPISGRGDLEHLILPSLTLAGFSLARMARLTRSSVIETLHEDYIRTAHSKGLGSLAILFKHALRNSAIPIITLAGFTFTTMLGGAVVTETIFAWPGLGRLLFQAVSTRDYPLVQGCVLLLAFLTAFTMFLIDVMYAWIDPRVQYS